MRRVEALSAGAEVPDGQEYGLGTQDTPAFPGMDEAARWLVGGTLHGARLISEGKREARPSARRGAASRAAQLRLRFLHLQRPRDRDQLPHPERTEGRLLDIDVHHGDGVQEILNEDPRVMTVSLHESGKYLFPGTGEIRELGSGSRPRPEAQSAAGAVHRGRELPRGVSSRCSRRPSGTSAPTSSWSRPGRTRISTIRSPI